MRTTWVSRRSAVGLFCSAMVLLAWHYPGIPFVGAAPDEASGYVIAAATTLLAAASLVGFLHGRRCERAMYRSLRGECPECGYDLHATPDRCPECGTGAGADRSK